MVVNCMMFGSMDVIKMSEKCEKDERMRDVWADDLILRLPKSEGLYTFQKCKFAVYRRYE